MNLAGAQIEDCTCEQAKTLIKEIIQDMTDEGEIQLFTQVIFDLNINIVCRIEFEKMKLIAQI